MFRSKRLWWAVIVFLFSIYTPTKARALKVDPYQFKNLTGKVTFEYERNTSYYDKSASRTYTNLDQTYTLDSTGNLFHRLLIIYDTGISYQKRISEYGTSKTDHDTLTYYLSTTFLPKSITPLTLRGRKTISGPSESAIYGFTWTGRFRRRLPYTIVSVDRETTETDGYGQENTDYRLNMKKRLGRSKNELRYSLSEGENTTTGAGSSTSAMDVSSQAEISRNTKIYLGGARGVSTNSDDEKSTIEALSASISSSPSEEFSQRHSYSFNRSTGKDSTSESNSYSGSLGYRLSKRLTYSMSLATGESDTDSLTVKTRADSLNTSGSLTYAVSSKFSLSESISYDENKVSGSETGARNLIDRTRVRVNTRASYRTRLRWAALNASYSVGYRQEKRLKDIRYGKAVAQSFSLGLSGMDAFGYATVSASGKHSYTEPVTGDISSRSTNVSLRARNKIWEKYLTLIGLYAANQKKTWLWASDIKNDRLSLNGTVLYFKTVLIRFEASRASDWDPYDEKSTTTLKRFSVSHKRRLYNGNLKAQIRYLDTNYDFSGASQRSSDIQFDAEYKRWLFRRIPWRASLTRTHRTTDGTTWVSTELSNAFMYQLRAWTIGAEHDYITREYLNSKSVESRILLTLSRKFRRRWL